MQQCRRWSKLTTPIQQHYPLPRTSPPPPTPHLLHTHPNTPSHCTPPLHPHHPPHLSYFQLHTHLPSNPSLSLTTTSHHFRPPTKPPYPIHPNSFRTIPPPPTTHYNFPTPHHHPPCHPYLHPHHPPHPFYFQTPYPPPSPNPYTHTNHHITSLSSPYQTFPPYQQDVSSTLVPSHPPPPPTKFTHPKTPAPTHGWQRP